MANDWIKMRADLFTHPKVVRISSALKADRLRTVGGLMSAWCLFDAHSVDGVLPGYGASTLDEHLGWPGFSDAMIAVNWLADDGESLSLPEFETHNGASAKRRAQDADRKKIVRKASAPEADKKRTREEKRREEKKQDQKTDAPSVLPVWLAPDVWALWVTHRGGKKFKPTAQEFSLRKLTTLRDAGEDPRAVIEQSIECNWTGLFPVRKGESHGTPHHGRGSSSAIDRVQANVERARREREESGVIEGTAVRLAS